MPAATASRTYSSHGAVLAPRAASSFGSVGDEDLYRIPGAAIATVVPSPSGTTPSIDARGEAVPVTWPGPSEIHLVTNASSPGVLRLRVSAVPGWKATIDGRPLALSSYLSIMLEAQIPPGRHVVELHYWPNRFTEGLVISGSTVIVLVAAAFVARRRRPRSSTPDQSPPLDETETSLSLRSTSSQPVT